MKIVGVGCGEGMLTIDGMYAVRAAKEIYGSARAIELVRAFIAPDCRTEIITDYRALHSLPKEAVVLSTGDPLLAGLGYLPGEVISGISSLQTACARLRVPWTNIAVVNAHGKDHAAAICRAAKDIDSGHVVFIIADPVFPVPELAAALPAETKIAICANLGYPSEKITAGTGSNPPVATEKLFCILIGY